MAPADAEIPASNNAGSTAAHFFNRWFLVEFLQHEAGEVARVAEARNLIFRRVDAGFPVQ